jgi:hypothetical protein
VNTNKVLYDAGRKVRVLKGSGLQGEAMVLDERLKLATSADELGDGSVVKPEELNAHVRKLALEGNDLHFPSSVVGRILSASLGELLRAWSGHPLVASSW